MICCQGLSAVAVAVGIALGGCHASPPSDRRRPTGAMPSLQPSLRPPVAKASPPNLHSADDCVREMLGRLTLRDQVGQLMMVSVPADDPASGAGLVQAQGVGGVFLVGRSAAGLAATRAGVRRLQQLVHGPTGVPLHVAVDQEGGLVQTLTGPGFSTIPSARSQGSEATSALFNRTRAWAAELYSAGITLDLAPVADTVAREQRNLNPPIGASRREYGSDPAAVATRVATVVDGMRAAGLGATLKHFPGLGRVRANTDTSTAAVDPITSRMDPNLTPFRAGIAAGAAAVMVSSASYPKLDRDRLAVFSPGVIDGLLRGLLAYKGLVLSDDLGHALAVQGVSPGERAVAFVAASGDVVLNLSTGDTKSMIHALLSRALASPTFADRVKDAALRVLQSKQALHLLVCK